MDAILIAGGHAPRRLAEVAGHSRKGLFSFGGMPLVQWVVRALLQAGFPRVAVVGSELLMQALPEDPNRVFFATEGRDPIDNLLRGAERLGLGPHDRFLHSAVDLPMITPEAVKDLLAHDDPEADPAHPGDGFSRYEEYRGFLTLAESGYERLNPNEKDVFIRDEDDLGLGFFEALGYTVHKISNDQWSGSSSREINYRHNTAHLLAQHAIWMYIVEEELTGGQGGNTMYSLPDATYIRIEKKRLINNYYTDDDLNHVIAHELGHACNLFPLSAEWDGSCHDLNPDPPPPGQVFPLGYEPKECIMDNLRWPNDFNSSYCNQSKTWKHPVTGVEYTDDYQCMENSFVRPEPQE